MQKQLKVGLCFFINYDIIKHYNWAKYRWNFKLEKNKMITFLNNTGFFKTFWMGFKSKFSSPWIWYALAFAVVGVTILILAKRIARLIKQKNDIDKNDGAYVTFVVVACMFIMASITLFVVLG